MHRISHFFAFILFVPALVALAACDDTKTEGPTANEITTAVIERFRDDPYAKVGHVENVTKTNSIKEADDETTVMVRYELVFDRSVADFADDVTEKGKAAGDLDTVGDTVSEAIDLVKTKMLALKEGEFKAGDRRIVESEIRLVKSEKGWIYRP
ncbi:MULTISPECIES: hypothetical protein [Thalassospira]|uniref:Lipoprotein n=1 Tax=Thalassospira permensis NBRC 106175 TaxID=1353532 RepID=A0ABR4TPT0_9PROT|nr:MULTISPECIES: hypothetical protein [Thalassospira]KEO57670.1 hypothetical protein SMB34_02870 [Thalassospira permensis NBRC 106175]MBR9781787.1 hypothetical protein [Rhodospirillales bacterium]MBR9819024.1 hypothetical protein [Rhodospirillales bacterium]RCK40872.1 hypothetical protein TH24_09200 [Thalassospira xiamenensis]